jgi:hypothetical protein
MPGSVGKYEREKHASAMICSLGHYLLVLLGLVAESRPSKDHDSVLDDGPVLMNKKTPVYICCHVATTTKQTKNFLTLFAVPGDQLPRVCHALGLVYVQ